MTVLDPKVYMANQLAANQLAEIQRTNQARKNFQNFAPKVPGNENRAGLITPQSQPKTLETEVIGKADVSNLDNFSNNKTLAGRDEARMGLQNQINYRDKIAAGPGLASGLLQDKKGRDITFFGSLLRPGDWRSGVDTAESYLLGARDKFADPEYRDSLKTAGVYQGSTTDDYARDAAAAKLIAPEVMEAVAKRKYINERGGIPVPGEEYTDREKELLARYDANPFMYQDNTLIKSLDKDRAEDIYKGTIRGKPLESLNAAKDELKRISMLPDGPDKTATLKAFKEKLDTSGLLDVLPLTKTAYKEDVNTVMVLGKDGRYTSQPKIKYDILKLESWMKSGKDMTKLYNAFQNVTPATADADTKKALSLRAQTVRLANIALSKGNETEYNSLVGKLAGLDASIERTQGMQGLALIEKGDVGLASAVWSNSTGRNIQIVPRDDGNFNIMEDGVLRKTSVPNGESYESFKNEYRLAFDSVYRTKMAEVSLDRNNKLFESNVKVTAKMRESEAEYRLEMLKGKNKFEEQKLKTGWNIKEGGDGETIFTNPINGDLSVLDSAEVEGPDGESMIKFFLRPVSANTQTNVNVGLADDPVATFKQDAGISTN